MEDYEDLYDDVNVGFLQGEGENQQQQQAGHAEFWQDGYKPDVHDQKQSNPAPEIPPQPKRFPDAIQDSKLSPKQQDQTNEQENSTPLNETSSPVDGRTSVFISDLQWWTTDTELEAALAEYGKIKGLRFIEERASGRSKGVCQVDFYDAQPAQACKENMNGRVFNGRACVVAWSLSPGQMPMNPAPQSGSNPQGTMKKTSSREPGNGREYSKPGMGSSGRGRGRGRGRGDFGQAPILGPYDPSFGPRGMYGMGFMGRGGYPGPYPGIPPHVNPAFLGRNERGWGDGEWDGDKYEEESAEFNGDVEGKSRDDSGRRHKYERDGDWDRDRNRDRERDRERDRGWDDDYSRKRRRD